VTGAAGRDHQPATEPGPAWVPTAHYRRLATVAVLPLLAAIVLGHAAYLVLAAPIVAALALAARRPGHGARISIRASGDRCFEGEQVTIRATAEPGGPAESVGLRLLLPSALTVSDGTAASFVQGGGDSADAEWPVTAGRWGRWDTGRMLVTIRSPGGLFTATTAENAGAINVFPRPPSLAQLALPAQLHSRIGDHLDRRPGHGTEFTGIRPFAPGDQLRRINWQVTSRRGALYVNQFAAQRATEIVAVIDAITDTGPAGQSTLDRAVRGAAAIARAYTRAGDRVGVITFYGPMRWVAPGSGQRQFFRVAETVLDSRGLHSEVSPDMARIPRAVLPVGALVIMFSPLLDERAIDAAIDLRERGYPVIVTDVLATSPVPAQGSAGARLALRLWRLERQALRYRLESLGIPVVGWPGEPRTTAHAGQDASARLDIALGRFARQRVRGGAR
jgi:uncharacterized protein (DUF58 family)